MTQHFDYRPSASEVASMVVTWWIMACFCAVFVDNILVSVVRSPLAENKLNSMEWLHVPSGFIIQLVTF